MSASPTSNAFTPGDSYRREDGVLMVEVKPGVFVNQDTALVRHGIVPLKTKGNRHGPTQGA
jgi:hypothetical protein